MTGPLKNTKWERFAQNIAAKKMTARDAYIAAGFRAKTIGAINVGASKMLKKAKVAARIEELQAKIVAKVVEKASMGEAEVLKALAQIAFSDIRRVVKWHGHLVETTDKAEGGTVEVVKRIVTNHVEIISSDKVDDNTAAAISEVVQTKDGLRVKLHPKLPALMGIAEILGLTAKKRAIDPNETGGVDVEEMSPIEIGRRIVFALDAARRARLEQEAMHASDDGRNTRVPSRRNFPES